MFRNEAVGYSELGVIPEVRVSCAAFADIPYEGTRGLTINKNRLEKKGERILTPIGGQLN